MIRFATLASQPERSVSDDVTGPGGSRLGKTRLFGVASYSLGHHALYQSIATDSFLAVGYTVQR